ncbi:hypothetical protein ABEB36_012047 [Hypothenemus hampei]|uniref:Cytochrome P450 n=1 Tax=Hypothenemus hampei TaxID=57062 RepID=A0ABD1ECI3_HYPHA
MGATMVLLIAIVLLGLICLHCFMKKLKDTSKYLKNVPGKKPFLFFGNQLDFRHGSTVLLDMLADIKKKYGNTVLIHDGYFSWFVFNCDNEFNELLYSSSAHIEKGPQYKLFRKWLGNGLLTSTGAHWKSHRKVITPSFHFSILKKFVEVFDRVGNNFMEKLYKNQGDNVEISNVTSLYALDVICEATMGVKIDALKEDNSPYICNIKEMCTIIVQRIFSFIHPVFYPLTWANFRERSALKVIHKHVDKVIDDRIQERNYWKNNSAGSDQDDFTMKTRSAFLDLLLDVQIDGKPLSRAELKDEVNTFMFEGHDTTSSAIAFSILMLATHPRVQEKAYAEQRSIFGSENIKNAPMTYTILNEMKYLELVMKETLRLYPSVPYFSRTLGHDVEFKGNLYPKGMTMGLVPYICHRDPENFPNPEEFIPERFENYVGKSPFAYTPFSAGQRNCIGQKFAQLEILSTLSKILRNFRLGPAYPEHKIQLAAEIILISKNGIRISLKAR